MAGRRTALTLFLHPSVQVRVTAGSPDVGICCFWLSGLIYELLLHNVYMRTCSWSQLISEIALIGCWNGSATVTSCVLKVLFLWALSITRSLWHTPTHTPHSSCPPALSICLTLSSLILLFFFQGWKFSLFLMLNVPIVKWLCRAERKKTIKIAEINVGNGIKCFHLL